MNKRETATEMGGLREQRRQECRSRRKLEGKSTRQKRMEKDSSEGDRVAIGTPSPLKMDLLNSQ